MHQIVSYASDMKDAFYELAFGSFTSRMLNVTGRYVKLYYVLTISFHTKKLRS